MSLDDKNANRPLLSRKCILAIYCPTYNHKQYIRKTLEGFVNQKTQYKYKVIVHDDASNDGTAEIIKEYVEKYPTLFIAILQHENQYSQGKKIFTEYIAPLITEKYIAICEGDDYWCDENKLEKQISYLEEHPECVMCTHDTVKINAEGVSLKQYINGSRVDRDYLPQDIIPSINGNLFHTSSVVLRKEIKTMFPSSFYIKHVGDYPMAVYAATKGTVHYFGKVMSCYRVGISGSWTEQNMTLPEKKVQHYETLRKKLRQMDEFTNGEYKKSFEEAMDKCSFEIVLAQRDFRKLISNVSYLCMFIRRVIRYLYKKICGKLILSKKEH